MLWLAVQGRPSGSRPCKWRCRSPVREHAPRAPVHLRANPRRVGALKKASVVAFFQGAWN